MSTEYRIAGDSCLIVHFANEISLDINSKVIALKSIIEQSEIPGIRELVPAYASLAVHYNPEVVRFESLKQSIMALVDGMNVAYKAGDTRTVVELPVLYGGEFDNDLETCAGIEGISVDELIKWHTDYYHYVFFLGFSPGHPYTARFERPFSFDRLPAPRLSIVAGSVVVRKNFTDLIPFEQPCGWYILGNTPLTITDFSKEEPFLIREGEWLKYTAISSNDYKLIKKDFENGNYKINRYTERTS